jgi:hypothetical protein
MGVGYLIGGLDSPALFLLRSMRNVLGLVSIDCLPNGEVSRWHLYNLLSYSIASLERPRISWQFSRNLSLGEIGRLYSLEPLDVLFFLVGYALAVFSSILGSSVEHFSSKNV